MDVETRKQAFLMGWMRKLGVENLFQLPIFVPGVFQVSDNLILSWNGHRYVVERLILLMAGAMHLQHANAPQKSLETQVITFVFTELIMLCYELTCTTA